MSMRCGAAVVVLAAACVCAAMPHACAAQDEGSQSWDFGTVKHGKKVSHTFMVRNTGVKPLRIKDTFTSCGCTASKATKELLLPAEEAGIEVTFDSAEYHGLVRQVIYVNTDSPEAPVLKLIITVFVT